MIAVRYHDSTKHHFNRFAPSVGYLDWATQPNPFRRYDGAPLRELSHVPLASNVPYAALFTNEVPPQPITDHSVGELLRCSMGLSAWKQYGQSRWALRVNPSSGNLHPTEAWVVHHGCVWHYAPREHALEQRCVFDSRPQDYFLVALTSIVWREAWKYGERAFRYCQHDVGHAIAALRFAAAMLGWHMALLPEWTDTQMATLLGLDRDGDFADAEREEPECIAIVGRDLRAGILDPKALIQAAREGEWSGRANRLSSGHIIWPLIDEAVAATRYPGAPQEPRTTGSPIPHPGCVPDIPKARSIILQRRSALAFDGRGVMTREALLSMLGRLRPGTPPWDVIGWPPHVHLVLFVHRVQDVTPGVYAFLRDPVIRGQWQAVMRQEFLWEEVHDGLFLLVPIDAGRIANRVSCDQDIAEEGFLSLAMIARFEEPLRQRGEWFYRRLFWECGVIGQTLYLEAEAAGGRATGIGCYYDDPVHDLLGLSGHAWQSLYHFSIGQPVEDTRLTSEPGYPWEGDQTP